MSERNSGYGNLSIEERDIYATEKFVALTCHLEVAAVMER